MNCIYSVCFLYKVREIAGVNIARMSATRNVLTLNERHEAIKLMESGLSARAVALKFNVGKTQMTNILKRKAEIINDIENNAPSDSKRKRQKTVNEDINDLCWKWFQDAVGRRVNVTGPLLKMKALKFAKDLGNQNFTASNGWLASFTKRHNVVFGTQSGERGDVGWKGFQILSRNTNPRISSIWTRRAFSSGTCWFFFNNS